MSSGPNPVFESDKAQRKYTERKVNRTVSTILPNALCWIYVVLAPFFTAQKLNTNAQFLQVIECAEDVCIICLGSS